MNRIIFLVVFCIVGVTFTYFMIRPTEEEKLPVINPIDLEDEMVDPELLRVGYGHRVGDFSFTDQEGSTFTQAEVKDKVFVVEYFFTTCKGICPRMHESMRTIYEANKSNPEFLIVAHTCNPETDSVGRLKKYADSLQIDTKKWVLLTGRKDSLYQMARNSYLFSLRIQRSVSPSISYLYCLYFGRHSYTTPKSKPNPSLDADLKNVFALKSFRSSSRLFE